MADTPPREPTSLTSVFSTNAENTAQPMDATRGLLVQIADVQVKIEGVLKTAESRSLLATAGKEMLEWMTSIRTADLHELSGDPISISADAAQHLSDFLRVLENSESKVKGAVSGIKITGRSASKKIRKCHKSLEDAWKLLTPHFAIINNPAAPAESPTLPDNPVEQGNVETPENHSPDAPTWTKALEPSRTILKFVAAVTPLIPVVGQFVQCGVDVGNAVIDILDGMSQNVQAIQDLCYRVTRLCGMIAVFQDRKGGYYGSGEAIQHLESFKRLCDLVRADVKKLKAQHPAGKIVFSSDNAAAIGGLNSKIDHALKELDLYLALNADCLLESLGQARLISLLGTANYGNIGYQDDDGTCLEGTREEVLQDLDEWADDPGSERLLVLKGQAGRGKSTIAKTLALRFRDRRGTSASSAVFHFRRGNEELNSRPIRALARQLVRIGDPRLRNAILQAVQQHEDVAESHLEEQLRTLFIIPLEKLRTEPPHVLLVIDGLDECGDHKFSVSLFRLILKHLPSLPSTVKFFLTTRPESHIAPVYQGMNDSGRLHDLDDVDSGLINRDLRAFFEKGLARIGREHSLHDDWQEAGAVRKLVGLSQGLFQWANTAIEYIDFAPEARLQKLLHSKESVVGLPALYRQIIEDAFSDRSQVDASLIQYVFGSLVAAPNSISLTSLAYLWDPPPDASQSIPIDIASEIQAEILNRLRSFLVVPASPDEPVRILHTSVRDFLIDPNGCSDTRFFVRAAEHYRRLAKSSLERMQRDLNPKNFDVTKFCGASQTSAEARDAFRETVSSGLVYCARSWSAHLSQVQHDEGHVTCQALHSLLDDFCQENLIHWMEILSLAGAVDEVNSITQQGKDWVGDDKTHSQTYDLLDHVQRLCRDSFDPIATSAHHISRSVLLHCAEDTPLRGIYSLGNHTPVIRRGPVNSNLHSFRMAVSPDGKMFAFGSKDGAIRLWDREIGKPIGKPLIGHTDQVSSIIFAPDGEIIASASKDETIRLWNPETGTQIGQPLRGHSSWILSVVFSPDGKMLASSSVAKEIRLWNPETGEPIGEPLIGHSDSIRGMIFSPNSKMIASGSNDKTIRLCNPDTGAQIGEPLTGHSDPVFDVTFSPDGKMIASGSEDNTIRLWNPETRMPIGEPLRGHTDWVWSVVFSPDSKMIASGSIDSTIRLWNPETRMPVGEPLKGHISRVDNVIFSPDGQMIASAAQDNTMRLWDPKTGTPFGKAPSGHAALINSMTFSPDGKMSASGSSDGTIRLWDLETGKPIGEPLSGHSGWVNSVALSSDGKVFASGSSDGAIRAWNPEIANPLGEPLQGNHGAIHFVGLSSDGKIIASRSEDKTTQLWDVENWMQIGEVPLDETEDQDDARSTNDSEALVALGDPGVSIQQKIVLHGSGSRGDMEGWVFRNNRRWFWLPNEWYSGYRKTFRTFLFNNIIVITHPDILILDVSDIM